MYRPLRMAVMLALISAVPAVQADIFHWRDADGRTHYGDSPPARGEAQRLEGRMLPPVNAEPPPSRLPRRAAPRQPRSMASTTSPSLKQCIAAKKRAVRAERKRPMRGNPELESWLWKNCRVYSRELRKVSQSMM